jgi:hypothetical protein
VTPWLVVSSGWPGTVLRESTELALRLRTVPTAVAWASLCTATATAIAAVGAGALWRLQTTRRRATATRSD